MFDLARLRGTALALASVALGLGISAAALRWAADCRPGWFPSMPSKMDVVALERVGGRVARAARDIRRDPRIGDRLGVILGSSTMQSALEPGLLIVEDGPKRWLNLCGPDASPIDFGRIARLLERGGVRPSVAVVGINVGMLADPGDLMADAMLADPAPPAWSRLSSSRPPASGPARLFRSLGRLAGDAGDWLRPNITKLHYLKDLAAFEWRLAAAPRVGIDAAFAPASDYWTPPPAWVDPATDEFRAWQVREYARKGWFSADAYGPDGPNVRALADLLARLRRLDSRVVLVLLPEPAGLRARVPAEAGRRLSALVAGLPPADAPEVLDLRDALRDGELMDLVHPGPLGREAVTRRVARLLAGPAAVARRP
ncbi:MAG TPA: hypothetical protein VGH33_26040 [Isosphaeraceae bacterium]